MKKVSILLSFLFVFGQILLPSLPVNAISIDNSNQTVISEELKDSEGMNINQENEQSDNGQKDDDIKLNEGNDESSNSEGNLEEDIKNENSLIESSDILNSDDNIEEKSEQESNNEDLKTEEYDSSSVEFGDVYEIVKKPRTSMSRARSSSVDTSQLDEYYYSKEEYAEDMNALEDIEYLVKKN